MGIGVDSNVLIFERIKEELAAQRGVRAAINAGFGRVFLTLLDTHVASLISAAFLFQFGTGPIRGFAMTLIIGLISNLFTSTFVSKTLFEAELAQRQTAVAQHLRTDHADLQDSEFRLSPLALARHRAVVARHPRRRRRDHDQGAAARRRVLRRHDRHRAVRPAAARSVSDPRRARARCRARARTPSSSATATTRSAS